ncbi:MAG: hypothetical protein QOJ65_1484 [Fimbriimonadaceae bacterium]|jgi:hypothetical protein|nr:hypothetical protein [Fimbriimonadaceae bacterium]
MLRVKVPAWIPAFILSAGIHAAVVIASYPALLRLFTSRTGQPVNQQGSQVVLAFLIGWCLLIGAWSAMVANVLSKPSNKWGGISGLRLFGIVAGLTLALDLLDTPCFYTCFPTALIIPILSFVAIFNNSMPPPEEDEKSVDQTHPIG